MEEPIRIPNDLAFVELCLRRDLGTGVLSFSPAALEKLCVFNNLDPLEVLAHEDESMNLICRWYLAHLFVGGTKDEVMQHALDELGLLSWILEARIKKSNGVARERTAVPRSRARAATDRRPPTPARTPKPRP